MILVGQFT